MQHENHGSKKHVDTYRMKKMADSRLKMPLAFARVCSLFQSSQHAEDHHLQRPDHLEPIEYSQLRIQVIRCHPWVRLERTHQLHPDERRSTAQDLKALEV